MTNQNKLINQYIENCKQRPFVIVSIILLVLSVVTYFYNFIDVMAVDDWDFKDGIAPYNQPDGWRQTINLQRAFGWLMSYVFNNGTAAQSVTLFLNLAILSGSVAYYLRYGLKIQSIFYSVLLAIPIIMNAGMGMQFNFVINEMRMIPAWFGLVLFSATIVGRNVISCLIAFVIVLCGVLSYQLIVQQYIIGVMAIVIMHAMHHPELPLQDRLKHSLRNKVLPAVLVLCSALLVYVLILKVFALQGGRMQSVLSMEHVFVDFKHNLSKIIKQVIFHMLTFSYDGAKKAYNLSLYLSIIAIIYRFYKTGWKNTLAIFSLIVAMLCLMPVLINFYELMIGRGVVEIRVLPTYGVLISLLFSLIYIAFAQQKWLRRLTTGWLIFLSLHIMQQTNVQAYQLHEVTEARRAETNRLFNDITEFARANKITHRFAVHFLYEWDYKPLPNVTYDREYLNKMNHPMQHYGRFLFQSSLFYNLGVLRTFYLYDNVNEIKRICPTIANDPDMHAWPFYNSMKLINGVVFVKLQEGSDRNLCGTDIGHTWLNNLHNRHLVFKNMSYDLAK